MFKGESWSFNSRVVVIINWQQDLMPMAVALRWLKIVLLAISSRRLAERARNQRSRDGAASKIAYPVLPEGVDRFSSRNLQEMKEIQRHYGSEQR